MTAGLDGQIVMAALLAGICVAALSAMLFPPTRRLAPRVRPYTLIARSRLGRSADVVASSFSTSVPGGVLWRLYGPPIRALSDRMSRWRNADAESALATKLRQAGYAMTPDDYRVRQLGQTVAWVIGAGATGYVVFRSPVGMLGFAVCGFLYGVTRLKSRLDNDLEARRARMRIELYTINLQLAMAVRASPGLVKHVERLAQRGRGEVVGELQEVLRWIRSGMSVPEAFSRAAALTPESWAARTYKLLAIADERGADLADGLLALSEDIRDSRREDMRRAAVKRTGAMLVPTIGILAPVMMLFIAAPLPTLIFGAN